MTQARDLFINGSWGAGSGDAFASGNPATGEIEWSGNTASKNDVAGAVEAAREAFPSWAGLSFDARHNILQTYRTLLEARKEEIAETIARENGKPLWDALGEASAMIGKIAISADAYQKRTPTTTSDTAAGRSVLRHRPHGVLAVFGPYNFPCHLANGHIVPALLAGNTVVFKPSELTPKSSALIVQCLHDAGVPQGVINLVQGARQTGEALASHPQIDGLLFTGSERVGRLLHEQFGGDMGKILALELGGNNPLIIHDECDHDAAALLAVQSAFITSGQRCTCARRLIVPASSKGDAFLEKLKDLTTRLIVGAWNDQPSPFMGPLISNDAANQVLKAQDNMVSKGAEPLLAATRQSEDRPFVTPGLIDVTDQEDREDKEVFGPLLQIIRTRTFDEAIAEANNTRFGLAAGLISNDGMLWEKFLTHARAGIVNWNKPLTGASSAAPFGGIGLSGNHRPSAYYAADYVAWPMASMEAPSAEMPSVLPAGFKE